MCVYPSRLRALELKHQENSSIGRSCMWTAVYPIVDNIAIVFVYVSVTKQCWDGVGEVYKLVWNWVSIASIFLSPGSFLVSVHHLNGMKEPGYLDEASYVSLCIQWHTHAHKHANARTHAHTHTHTHTHRGTHTHSVHNMFTHTTHAHTHTQTDVHTYIAILAIPYGISSTSICFLCCVGKGTVYCYLVFILL